MARILVSEKIADSGLDQLRRDGHEVDIALDLSAADLLEAVKGASALIIRSATQVTAEVLQAGTDLVVVGRAGIGLDNVDVAEATRCGVMVVNAPQSNIISAAEHTMALLLSQARNVPQAHSALVAGKWERSKWEGAELYGKTLGVVGLGRVGALVAQRALAFGMRLVAYDPFVSADRARQMGVTLAELSTVVAESDFLTVHLPKTPETMGMLNSELFSKAKPTLRVINTARGGIIDEQALYEAISSGKIQGAALDVFDKEPTTESPLFGLSSVVVTPHLGASTLEAQDKAGITIAEQVGLALAGEFVPFAVNVSASEASETMRPYLPLSEQLGKIFASLVERIDGPLEVAYEGEIADYDTRILTLAFLKGLLGQLRDEQVTYVNAPQLAEQAGLEIRETRISKARDFVSLLTVSSSGHSIAGTVAGSRAEPRLVMVDDHTIDVPPQANMLIVTNADKPGMIGRVGTAVGQAGVNISDMALGRSRTGEAALMVMATDDAVSEEVVAMLKQLDGVQSVRAVRS